jgi:ABC-type transport system involved in cytochrome bd biosynthesis fused ATPase/permease subunit
VTERASSCHTSRRGSASSLVSATQVTRDVESVWEKYFELLTLPFQIGKGIYQKLATGGRAGKTDLTVLEGIDGRIRPGTLTCIIAPPGHGKSAFLKALTQLLPKGTVTGEIKYGGMTREEANAKGIYMGQMVQYVGAFTFSSPCLCAVLLLLLRRLMRLGMTYGRQRRTT